MGPTCSALQPQRDDTFELGQIWDAIAGGRVVNHYQPQVDLLTGRPIAAEALVRLTDATGKLVFPDRFITKAEEDGIIVPLGRTVIRQACEDLARWRGLGLCVERVAINLSAYQLKVDDQLACFVGEQLTRHALRFEDLEFELTERQNLDLAGCGLQTLQVLSSAGTPLSLDDFGTGYSSLHHLTELDIDTVKLDRSMVAKLPDDPITSRVIGHLMELAADLGLSCVAEGIETEEQRIFLAEAGCNLAQGYLFAKPMERDALADHFAQAQA